MGAAAVEEMRDHAALVLRERAETATGMDRLRPEPFLDGTMDHALQPAAMNGELRHVVAGIEAARLAPHFLAVAVEIIQLVGANSGSIEPIQQSEAGQLADRMRQRVDTDAKLADAVGLLEQLAVDTARAQHQRGGEASDAASDDDCLHASDSYSTRRSPTSPRLRGEVGSHREMRSG
jgi:hypothetical protein